ncbi:hypothetical protein Pcinc_022624 [Petrolisthes cinctipes]|uniref:Uncharacterized protein n=1 Tax=Petrolisthes cinctipes TaxID=88211 RepID=A0AAE1FEQ1_PETCI|nr:hypothetical protein Pcinc_022624 [Petrolisthes cinctipes]
MLRTGLSNSSSPLGFLFASPPIILCVILSHTYIHTGLGRRPRGNHAPSSLPTGWRTEPRVALHTAAYPIHAAVPQQFKAGRQMPFHNNLMQADGRPPSTILRHMKRLNTAAGTPFLDDFIRLRLSRLFPPTVRFLLAIRPNMSLAD